MDAYDRAAIDHPLSDVLLRGNGNHADQCLRTCLWVRAVWYSPATEERRLLCLLLLWLGSMSTDAEHKALIMLRGAK